MSKQGPNRSPAVALIGQFAERLPICRGTVARKSSTATAYAWFVWRRGLVDAPATIRRSPGTPTVASRS